MTASAGVEGAGTALHTLTASERELVQQLKDEVAPLIKDDAGLIAFCIEHTYVRYLRARQWNLPKAAKMLKATLEWRVEYKPHLIRWDEVAPESVTGKQYVQEFDKAGRPIIFMRPRNENTKDHERQIKYLIYNLEMASRLADQRGVGKMCWVLDFDGYTMANAVPLRVSMHCNNILANHYPERLGCAVCFHAPYIFSLTWKAVQPFIDPVTKQKIVFIEKGPKEKAEMESRFHLEHVEVSMGGSLPNESYNHDKQAARMKQMDVEVEAEIAAIEAKLKGVAARDADDGAVTVSENTQADALVEATDKLSVGAA